MKIERKSFRQQIFIVPLENLQVNGRKRALEEAGIEKYVNYLKYVCYAGRNTLIKNEGWIHVQFVVLLMPLTV